MPRIIVGTIRQADAREPISRKIDRPDFGFAIAANPE
jgi:hypothetical protein